MGKVALSLAAAVLSCLLCPAARADTVTFNNDPVGAKANGFQSVDSSLVRFSTSPSAAHPGQELFLFYFGDQISTTNALATSGETTAAANIPIVMILDFSVPVTSLSLDYGNDEAGHAVLTLYRNGVVVGQVVQNTNGNTAVDQTISFSFDTASGLSFDRATFGYDFGAPEIIDNVRFTPAGPQAVPEPASLLLLGSGLAGLALRRGRRRPAP